MTRLLTILGAIVLAAQCLWLPLQVPMADLSDADVYHQAAVRLAAGQPVYGSWRRERLDQPPGAFLYPPTALMLFKPFAGLSRAAFRWGWYGLIIAAFWALAAALGVIVRGKFSIANVLAAGALLQAVPGVVRVMVIGNADLIVWALVAWAFAAPRLAGALLALGGALKVYPAVLCMTLAHRASRRFWGQAAIAGFGIIALTWGALGSGVFHGWKTIGLPALNEAVLSSSNFSWSAQLVHIFVRDMTKPLPAAARVFLTWFPYVVVATVVWTQRQRSMAMYAVTVLVTTVGVAPICWWWRLSLALTLACAVWIRERTSLLYEAL